MYIIQSVLNQLNKINPIIKIYVLNLLLSSSRKNCAAMAESTGSSRKKLYSYLSNAKKHSEEIEKQLISIAKTTRKKDVLRALVIDPSNIIKQYSKKIEKVSYDRSGCTGRVERCLVPVFCSVTDKNVTIPLTFNFWIQKKVIGKKRYKSKVQLAQELIIYAMKNGIEFDFVSLDGAFCGPEMFIFFKKHNLKFSMRMPRNRKIKIEDKSRIQLQEYKKLKLLRNERVKTIKAELYDDIYSFTSQKRKKAAGGFETVFIVSNMDIPAKEQVSAYDLRWPMEKMIRTTKQKLGTTHCQVVSASKQRAHILAGLLAYAILDSENNDKLKQSVDEKINIIRKFQFNDLGDESKKIKQSKPKKNIDPIAKPFQKYFRKLTNYHEQASYAR